MTPDERALLNSLGSSILVSIGELVATVLHFGIFCVLFSFVAYHFLRKRRLAAVSMRALFATSAFSFVCAWTICMIYIATTVVLIRGSLVDNRGMAFADKQLLANARTAKLQLSLGYIFGVLPIITDSVTIWRGAVLFPQRRWGSYLAIFLCFASFVLNMVNTAISTRESIFGDIPFDAARITNILDNSSVILSLATNAVVTGFVAYGVWEYRKFLINSLHMEQRLQFRVYKIMRLLVESGFTYCGLQAITVALFFVPQTKPLSVGLFLSNSFFFSYVMWSAIYPTLILFLAKQKGQFQETYTHHSSDEPEAVVEKLSAED